MPRARKNRTQDENLAISMMADKLINVDGLEPERAVAAAFRMYREKSLPIIRFRKPTPLSSFQRRQQQRQRQAGRKGAAKIRNMWKGK